MFQKLNRFLDDNPWATWVGMAIGAFCVFAIEGNPEFPFNLF